MSVTLELVIAFQDRIYGACFSPDGKRILLKFDFHAVVLDIVIGGEQFRIKGKDFAFTHHDGKIASSH